MTQYQGNVQSRVLEPQSSNEPYTYVSDIRLHGACEVAILYVVAEDGQLERSKDAMGRTFSISIIGWIPGRISPTCCATRSRCTSRTTILTTRLKSQAFAPVFLVGHPALPNDLSKPTSFPDKIAKKNI